MIDCQFTAKFGPTFEIKTIIVMTFSKSNLNCFCNSTCPIRYYYHCYYHGRSSTKMSHYYQRSQIKYGIELMVQFISDLEIFSCVVNPIELLRS